MSSSSKRGGVGCRRPDGRGNSARAGYPTPLPWNNEVCSQGGHTWREARDAKHHGDPHTLNNREMRSWNSTPPTRLPTARWARRIPHDLKIEARIRGIPHERDISLSYCEVCSQGIPGGRRVTRSTMEFPIRSTTARCARGTPHESKFGGLKGLDCFVLTWREARDADHERDPRTLHNREMRSWNSARSRD